MDPLSAAASAAGLLDAANRIVKGIETIKNAPKQIRNIKIEVEAIQAALEQVQALIILRDKRRYHDRGRLLMVEHVMVVMSGLVLLFSELESIVEDFSKEQKLGLLDRAGWLIKESTVKDLTSKVQNSKSSLILILTVLQAQSQTEAEALIERLVSLVEGLQGEDRPVQMGANPTPSNVLHQMETVNVARAAVRIPNVTACDLRTLAFEHELYESRPYRRSANNRDIDCQTIASALSQVSAFSVLSRFSVSEVSHVAVLRFPITLQELSNGSKSENDGSNADEHICNESNDVSLAYPEDLEPAIFGIPLEQSLRCANMTLKWRNVLQGSSYRSIEGSIPLVVAKTTEFFIDRGRPPRPSICCN